MKFLVGLVIGMMVTLVAGRWLNTQATRLGTKRVVFVIAVGVISGLIIYPALHEAGHMLFGMWCGAVPDWDGVVWTCLSGKEPHGAFSYTPEQAVPLMQAGGHILPTLVAVLLLCLWRAGYSQVPWWVSAALVTMPVLFLFTTLGCVFELYSNTHLDALAVGWGLSGLLRILLSLSPPLLAAAVFVWLGRKYRHSQPAVGGAGPPRPKNTADHQPRQRTPGT